MKIIKEKGYVFKRHGKKHDLYKDDNTGKEVWLERHFSQEIRTSLLNKLKKDIGF